MHTDSKMIFLVDDDINNLVAGERALGQLYKIVMVNSGEQLMEMLSKARPDLILVDVGISSTSGYEIIAHVKNNENYEDIPVIFVAAKSDSSDSAGELKGLSLGAVDYVSKPFSSPLLQKRIQMHLLIDDQKKELTTFNTKLKEMVDEKTKAVVELQNAVLKAMAELAECRDDITGSHIERTQGYLHVLIDALIDDDLYKSEVSTWDIELVLQSAQLHDVGKIVVDDKILRKPGKLTPDEFEEIKIHTIYCDNIIERIKKNTSQHDFLEQARLMASTHHERWDGSGYPKGLKGAAIPLQGRLMAIADVYDALVSERPYKSAFTHEKSICIIKSERGTHFDPHLVDVFLSVSDEFRSISVLNGNHLC